MRPKNTSHRDRDDRRKARELSDVKSENAQLRRQVARLQREKDRLECLAPPDEGTEEVERKPKSKQKSCQSCGKDKLKEMTTPGGKKIITCVECLARQAI